MNQSIACGKCGAPVAPGTRFCPSCGADVSGQQGNVATAHVPRADVVRATMSDTVLLDALRDATLGEYEILGELGRGGMATVYLAHDLALDRKVAIKVMAPALLAGEGMVERFKREARTSAQLSHPHIIPIFAVRESENLVYFVMKFVEGRSLESIIKELGPLPIPMAQSILQQVGGALAYAHRRGVIHRDIKPGNIMIDADGWAVVTDFGIAKVSEARGLTMTGATVGTPSYMSPEQCAAQDITPASDQYSFGVVAHEMFAGKQPFTGDSIMAIMYQHFNDPPPPLREARPDCPVAIEAAVLRMLEKDPAARFPDLDQAAAAIGGAPLAPDDPIRTQLMTIVASGAQAKLLRTVTTPRSPMPAGRTRVPGKATRVEPTTGMSLSPARVTVAVGGSVQLTGARKSRSGATLPGDAITWASTNADVATVDENGLVTAVRPGQAIITATMGAVSATGTVTVTPAHARPRRLAPILGLLLLVGGGGGAAAWFLGPWRQSPAPSPSGTSGAQTSSATGQPSGPATGAPVTPPVTLDSVADSSAPANTTAPPTRAAPPPRRATPVVTRPPADTVGPRLQAEAQRARLDALAAGATEAELAGGDALVREARQLAQDGRRAEALSRFSAGLAAWTGAAQAARTRAAQAAAPPRTEPPAAVQPAPVDPRPEIVRTIAAYARALEARDVNAIRQVYPGLTRRQEEAWRGLFQSVREVHADLRPSNIQVQGADAASAAVGGTLELVTREGRQRQPITFQASLERGPAGWRIREIR